MEGAQADVPITILIASSDRYIRCVLRRALDPDQRFLVVGQVTDGGSVVAYPAAFDLLAIDVAVDGLGVFGVMSRLQGDPESPAIVVVARSDCPTLRPAVAVEGGVDYLLIPRDLDHVAERFLTAVSRRKTADAGIGS
jgi:DNA-binding NtrC family response regulator